MADRDNNGKFVEGNKVAKKPIKCPYCKKEIEIKNYLYIREKK